MAACPQTRPERLLPDQFWMFSYKVVLCPLKHSHDWEKCIYAHDGEKARRRHPSKYQAVQCPEARAKKMCPRGEDCPCTHHLFEYWLHPDRYMTCLCELGANCNRPICFFAHYPHELRPLPGGLSHAANSSGSSRRRAAAAAAAASGTNPPDRQSSCSPSNKGGAQVLEGLTGLQTPSSSSLTGMAGQDLAGTAAPGCSLSAGSSGELQPLQQPGLLNLSDPRPGFSALDALSASAAAQAAAAADAVALSTGTLAATEALKLEALLHHQQQQQLAATRAAAARPGNASSPQVMVLEAPAQLPPRQDIQLVEAAQQFSRLNLTASGTGWLSPSTTLGQSNSNMSLASSSSSTLGITGLAGNDGQLAASVSSSTNTALLLEAAQQQLLRARSVSPMSSPAYADSRNVTVLAFTGSGGAGGNSGGLQQLAPTSLALMGPGGHAQLATMQQLGMEEPPEQLSFSLWDLNTPAGTPAQVQQQLASLVGTSAGGLTSLGGFDGFAGGNTASSSRPAASAAPFVAHLASSAADRLLLAQQGLHATHGISASMGLSGSDQAAMAAGVGGSSNDASNANTNKQARLTLLRAWMNAAAAAADGRTTSNDGTLQQQQQLQEDQLLQEAASASVSTGGFMPLRAGALRAVAQDLMSVMAPADVPNLVQQLQLLLQRDSLQRSSALYL